MYNEKYDYDYIIELCNRISLLEYAEKTYEFKKRGDKYFCSCPKHNDSDPSLCISPDVNLFYCFSCGRNGNIINWLMEYENLSFPEAINKVAELTDTDISNYTESETMSFYKLLKRIETHFDKREQAERTVLDIEKDYQQRFSDELPQEWLDEGISSETMKKYEIRIDPSSNRIVYPVYDADYNFIAVKGRTRFKNYKDLKIQKYMNYNRLGVVDYFTGMEQAEPFVKSQNEIIIVEGIKSVMKLDGWGYHNVVSAETSKLNEYQIELLIKMHIKDVIIAFDNDVPLQKIKKNVDMLKKFANVAVVIDRGNILEEKDSPCDKGIDVWKILYQNRLIL